jgi:hypothetical protein
MFLLTVMRSILKIDLLRASSMSVFRPRNVTRLVHLVSRINRWV